MIEFIQDTELEIVETLGADGETPETSIDVFKEGEQAEGEILEDRENDVDIQFADGSMAFAVPKDCFRIVE